MYTIKQKFKDPKENTAKYFPDLGVNEVFIINLKQKEKTILEMQAHLNPFLKKVKLKRQAGKNISYIIPF